MLIFDNPLPALCVGIVGALIRAVFGVHAAPCQLFCAVGLLCPAVLL